MTGIAAEDLAYYDMLYDIHHPGHLEGAFVIPCNERFCLCREPLEHNLLPYMSTMGRTSTDPPT